MDDFEHPILSHGCYRLVALSTQPHYSCDAITGYAVTTAAGDRLRVEATQSQAHAWLQEQLRQDAVVHPPPARMRR